MKRAWKWILPASLAVLIFLVFSYGSLAAFTQSFIKKSAPITTKSFVFYVNESSSERQSLGNAALAPGESKHYSIVLDGRSSETAVDALVTLNVSHDGVWPDGFSVRSGGKDVSNGFSRTYTDLHSLGDTVSVPIEVVWDDPMLKDYEAFRGFTLHISVTVDATQAN
jgi:hypothetical protein